ncbi:MAG: carboxypeptidase-like regulatory domain-containing protein, partial [Acidobacteriota bacterium]|nr:carboxypeptidase-like regulatory domain-containing protein [Acidobacteriota bacterium]
MKQGKQGYVRLVATALSMLLTGTGAFAQGASTSSISGVVVDSERAVVPGADVVIKNQGTGETFNTITSGQGVFSVPSLITGTYTVTISLSGFKNVVIENVVVNAGVPASLRATLEVGGLTEQVIVQSNAELVQSQSATVSTTLDTRQVASLPLSSRSAFDFVIFLPGTTTPGGSRDTTINGLPQGTINITLDGVNIQDNTNKTTDGFFAIVGPRIDAVEEITFSSAAQGAEGTGMGASQIRFVTKSGTNEFRGAAYYTYRSDELNANSWFNKRDGLAKAELLRKQPGFNIGGPVMLPGFSGRNRAFFFVNYEELREPAGTRRTRQILSPLAQQGVVRYNAAGAVQSVNLFELAARLGQTSTPDPTIARLLNDIRSATGREGNVRDQTDPLFQEYSFQNPTRSMNRYPTARVDYQINDRHRVTYSMNFQYFGGGPDTTNSRDAFFPGFPVVANQSSTRRATSGWLRSMLGRNVVNEFRVGYGGAPVIFAQDQFTPDMWSGTLANQGGFHLNLNSPTFISNAGAAGTTSARDAFTRSIENTLNWQLGSHSINLGGSFSDFELWAENQQIVPELRFGVVQGDPADAMFTAANFPGASTTALANARSLYAILTGRVSEVRGTARLNADGQYEYLGQGTQLARQREVGFWVQDSWRARSNLSLNYGLRYELQYPFVSLNSSYSIGDYADVFGVSGAGNLFKPGVLTGRPPTFRQLKEGVRPYPMDWNNIAPSIGAAWTPSARSGFLRKLTGETGDLAIRGGYSRSYSRNGLGTFTGAVGDNPGVSLNVFRSLALGNLGTLPVLMRDGTRLGAAEFPQTFVEPYTEVVTGDITVFGPNLRVPSAQTWQAGFQRAIGRRMSVEARYVGSRSDGNWRTNDYNELNIIENGFLDEFRLAQANLQANVAAGRGGTFAYMGPGTGTAPLPIFLAYFNGAGRDRAGDPSLYTSANFRSSTFLNPLARFNPNPYAAVDALDADAASRSRAIAAGLPPNFILANPHLIGADGANIVENTDRTTYNSIVLEFKRRAVSGLHFQTSYALGKAMQSRFLSLRRESPLVRNDGNEGDVTHAAKFNLVYDLPFGQGQRFGGAVNGVVDRIIGGWQIGGNVRLQSGQLVDFGNVRLVGMDAKELAGMYKVRIDAQRRVWMLPEAIINESVKAFSVNPTSATGYSTLGPPSGKYLAPADSIDCIETIRGWGDCGLRSVVFTGPMFKQFDIGISKRVPTWNRATAEFRIDVLNAFDHVNFVPVSGMVAGTTTANASNRANGANPDNYDV